MGGCTRSIPDTTCSPSASVFVFAPARDTWTAVASLRALRASDAAEAGPDGRVYFMGGNSPGRGFWSKGYAYAPAHTTWAVVASLPAGRAGLAAATGSDGRIHAIGGEGCDDLNRATVHACKP